MYLSYKKIVSQRNVLLSSDSHVNKKTITLMAFEKEDGITFLVNTFYPRSTGRTPQSAKFKLKISTKKDGTKTCNFYNISKLRICDPFKMDRIFHSYQKLDEKDYKEIEIYRGVKRTKIIKKSDKIIGLSKTAKLKLYRYLKKVLKKHKIEIKWFSKDPIYLLKQICYPGTMNFDDKFLKNASLNSYFKKEPLRSIGSNGSATRNILYTNLNQNPEFAGATLILSRHVRIKYGIDKVRQFLESTKCKLTNSMAKGVIKHFKHLSFEKFLRLFGSEIWLLRDTLMMLDNHDEDLPEFNNLQEFHDTLAVHRNRMANKKLRETMIPEHDVMKKLLANWNCSYDLILPEKGGDLIDWSTKMRNCVSSYIQNIKNKTYYILGISLNNELKYNVGFAVHSDNFLFSQWSGVGNSRIPENIQNTLAEQFNKIPEIRGVPCPSTVSQCV